MPNYDFTTLSPVDFELLIKDLLRKEYGWFLETFGRGKDGGVDLRLLRGGTKTVVQCKHYAGSRFSDLDRAAKLEKLKMDREKPNRYLFITSLELSRGRKDQLALALAPWARDARDILTRGQLNTLLGDYPEVEQDHFKLWLASTAALRAIVDSGVWVRSEALLEDISLRVRLYVTNPSYRRALNKLTRGGVLVITGAPGVGKSMLGEMLALDHWHRDWQIVQVATNIEEAWRMHDRSLKQLFVYDDFLGQTDIAERLGKGEGSSIGRFVDMVLRERNKRLILTTRTQVLHQARDRDENLARSPLNVRACTITLKDYSLSVRAQMLYNHLYFSSQPRSTIRSYAASRGYWDVLKHANFTPRIVEQVLRQRASSGEQLRRRLERALDRPVDLWGPTFRHALSALGRRILLALVTFPPFDYFGGPAPTTEYMRHILSYPDPIEWTSALRVLEGTWIEFEEPDMRMRFADASCRDFILAALDDDRGLLSELLLATQSLDQVGLLLGYALSQNSEGQWTYLVIRDGIRTHRATIARMISELWKLAASDESRAAHTGVVRALCGASELLGPEFESWLFGVLREIPRMKNYAEDRMSYSAGWDSALDWLLKQAVVEIDLWTDADQTAQSHAFWTEIEECAGWMIERSLSSAEEIELLAQRWQDIPGVPTRVVSGLDDLVRDTLRGAITDELRDISGPRSTREEWVDELRMIAARHGLESALAYNFDQALDFDDDDTSADPPDSVPALPANVAVSRRHLVTSGNTEQAELTAVEALFNQLT